MCFYSLWSSFTACDCLMWLCNQFLKNGEYFILWIIYIFIYITYWGQYKPRMRKKWYRTKIIWNWPRCKVSRPSFSSRWNSIPDWAYTIISYFLINSGNVKCETGLYPVEIYLFKANNNDSKTKYEICSEL